jgi:hypothetical protein
MSASPPTPDVSLEGNEPTLRATFCRTRPQQKQQAISLSNRGEVRHRLTECDVISFAIARTDEVNE